MLFYLFFTICQSIHASEASTPASDTIPISVSIDQMDVSSGLQCDTIECLLDETDSNCGKRCLASSGNDYFQYKFYGEQFQIYGSTGNDYADIKIYLDNNEVYDTVSTAGEDNPRTLLYTSPVLQYGLHTIKVNNGNTGKQYGIYKFTYWPSTKAKRINFEDDELGGGGNWQKRSDGIGRIVGWTNNRDSTAQTTMFCSRIWFYGAKDPGNGNIEITLYKNGRLLTSEKVSQYSNKTEQGCLFYDSGPRDFGAYSLKLTNPNDLLANENMYISVSYIFYEYDPPTQSPAPDPTQVPTPVTQEAFLNKEYHNYIPCGFPKLDSSNTVVKEITGCRFYDITSGGSHLTGPVDNEIGFSNNLFEYSEGVVNPTIAYFRSALTFTIDHCTFTNFKFCKKSAEGLIFSFNQRHNLTFETCTFNNIGQSDEHYMFKLNGENSGIYMRNCRFYNDENNEGCKICNFICPNITFDSCTFIKPARDMIRITLDPNLKNGKFQFIGNTVEKCKRQFIMATQIPSAPVIQNNVFQDIDMISGYMITFTLYNYALSVELFNNTFQRITTQTETSYCGGIGNWFQSYWNNYLKLVYRKCYFYDITNNNARSPFNQGGAFQYGYTTSISKVNISFNNCEFKRNVCTNGCGGALAFNIYNNLMITDCLFENNKAKERGGAIYFWSQIKKPVDNPNAPEFDESTKIESFSITNCQFKGNSAGTAQAISVNEYYSLQQTELSITGCTFTDNGEQDFVIYTATGKFEFDTNTIQFTDKAKSAGIIQFASDAIKVLNIIDSNFINCYCDQLASIDVQSKEAICTLSGCHFTNCKTSSHVIKYVGTNIEVDSCSFSFDNNDSNSACGAIWINALVLKLENTNFYKTNAVGAIKFTQKYSNDNPEVLVRNCLFDDCVGANLRCFDITLLSTAFTFQDVVFQNFKESGNEGYFIGINGDSILTQLTLVNVTFQNNRCNSDYGGGSGIWFTNIKDTIRFDRCKFINNMVLEGPKPRDKVPDGATEIQYFSGDGGAVQFGFSNTIFNVNLEFDGCEFTNNKAVRHGGALALQTVRDVKITQCIFSNNVANFKETSSSELLDYNNYFSKKIYGRGGAIYINPAFNHNGMDDKQLHMQSVTISDCEMSGNSAYDGFIMYIQGDDPGTVFDIKNNIFTNNLPRGSSEFVEKSSILTELPNVELPDSNRFVFDDSVINKPKNIEIGNPEDPEEDGPDTLEVINVTTHGRHQYEVTDNSKLIVSIIISYFHDIRTTGKDGGALYIKNAGLACDNITFVSCSAVDGKGGAICVINDYDTTNYARIITCNITQCSAKVGGGLFIHSINQDYQVVVRFCSFTLNSGTATSADSLYGGSGAFIAAKRGKIKGNTFIDNTGDGNALRLSNDFESIKNLLSTEKLIVSDNKFFLYDSKDGAVFYTRGKGGPLIELSDCIFEGKLKEGRQFIEGETLSKGAPKLVVKNCKFAGDSSNAVKLDSDFLSVDLKHQVFNSQNTRIEKKLIQKSQKKSALLVIGVVAAVSVATVVGLVVFLVKKVKQHDSDDNEMPSDANGI